MNDQTRFTITSLVCQQFTLQQGIQFTTFRGGLPSRTRRQFWLPLIRISSAPSSE